MNYEITFPQANDGAQQDSEVCDVVIDGSSRRIRFHDYDEIYEVPGLYEHLFYDVLDCRSPKVVCDLLAEQLEAGGFDPARQVVLDLGAGNGMVGECLAEMGCGTIVGADILPEAAMAAERDRPGVYTEYLVADLTAPTESDRATLAHYEFGVMTTVAALGFGDIPPAAFEEAYSHLHSGGWLAFCIKEDFLEDAEPSGFNTMLREMLASGELETFAERRYQHRLSAAGEPLHYVALIARKTSGTAAP